MPAYIYYYIVNELVESVLLFFPFQSIRSNLWNRDKEQLIDGGVKDPHLFPFLSPLKGNLPPLIFAFIFKLSENTEIIQNFTKHRSNFWLSKKLILQAVSLVNNFLFTDQVFSDLYESICHYKAKG